MKRRLPVWQPSGEQMALWPGVSGNDINGVGESTQRRPSPIYWHAPDATPHGPMQRWFYAKTADLGDALREARVVRQRAVDAPLVPIAEPCVEKTPRVRSEEMKRLARAAGAAAVGITPMRDEYVFEGHPIPPYSWMIVVAVAQDYDAILSAPSPRALVEFTLGYARGTVIAKEVANGLRAQGHDAFPYGGPMAGSFQLIPAAIAAGLGELGKHGSLIHPELGANFRLACVLTNAPLVADVRDVFGASDFCTACRVCADACPPDAIAPSMQLVRGEVRWYVDFDKCLPYFNENTGCGICIAVCPFSRPEIGPRLVGKLAAKRAQSTT
jgi:epoxyqueuosine reductase